MTRYRHGCSIFNWLPSVAQRSVIFCCRYGCCFFASRVILGEHRTFFREFLLVLLIWHAYGFSVQDAE